MWIPTLETGRYGRDIGRLEFGELVYAIVMSVLVVDVVDIASVPWGECIGAAVGGFGDDLEFCTGAAALISVPVEAKESRGKVSCCGYDAGRIAGPEASALVERLVQEMLVSAAEANAGFKGFESPSVEPRGGNLLQVEVWV